MRIKKTSETTPIQAQVVNQESNSTEDTYSCDYINNAVKEVYSTDEQVIGTWIDGKPLYRKVLNFNMSAGTYDLVHNLSIDKIANVSGCCKIGSDIAYDIFPKIQVAATNSVYAFQIYQFIDKDTIRFKSTWAITDCYIIIEYTKTTDTAEV